MWLEVVHVTVESFLLKDLERLVDNWIPQPNTKETSISNLLIKFKLLV